MKKLKKGMKAPAFEAPDQNGKLRSLKEFEGKTLVLYFYPKDDTPTCTEEACNLRDNYRRFVKASYTILGISMDNARAHKKFIAKYKLPFDLLSDPDHSICERYGVWGEKTLFGRTYMGIIRTTFIINPGSRIEEIIEKVISKDHSAQILS